MDGTRTVREIVVERFQDRGDLHLSGVADLVELLRQEGFLDRRPLRVDETLRRALEPGSRVTRAVRRALRTLSVEWRGADRPVRWLHDRGLRHVYRPAAVAAMAVLSVAGLLAFAAVHRSGRFALTGRSAVAESLALLALGYLLTFLHELGHALTLVHFGRRVKSAGFMLYFGSPAFFVDASEGLNVMTTGTRTLGRPAHLRSLIAGFTAVGLAIGLTAGILVTREVLEEPAVPTVRTQSPTAIWENSAAAVREQGAVLPWYVVPARAGFTGRLGGATEDSTIVRRHGHLTPKSSVFDGSSHGPVVVNGEPCRQCL